MSTLQLRHYSAEPLGRVRSVRQPRTRIMQFAKPQGLWVSVDNCENAWPDWCVNEGFGLERLTHVHEVTLSPTNDVLHLASADALDDFTTRFGNLAGRGIWWSRVAAKYQGLIIAPYIWERRLHENTGWYYGWDCASGCIWDAAAISAVSMIGKFERAAA